MEGFSLGPRASHGAAAAAANDGAPPREVDRRRWSASDRARRVSQSDALQALLHDEIERSGFLTSAGHRTVVQRFLRSDAVEEEMRKEAPDASGPPREREGLFRRYSRMVSSDGTTHSGGGATGASVGGRTVPSQQARRRSSGSIFSLFSSDALAEIELAAEGEADRSDPDFNIAPRRTSQTNMKFEYSLDAKFAEEQLSSRAREESALQDSADAVANDAAARTADEEDEEDEREQQAERPSFAFVNACAEDMLKSLRDARASKDDGRGVRSDPSDEDSDADECGWLPWPERRD